MQQWEDYLALIQREVVPALGCTEPVTVALAAAKAQQVLACKPERLVIRVTPNLYKNGMGVQVPGTGKAGLAIAAAVGAIAGDADAGLEVLKSIDPQGLAAAIALLEKRKVTISMQPHSDVLYTVVEAFHGQQVAEVCIAKSHTRFEYIKYNGKELYRAANEACGHQCEPPASLSLNMADIYRFSTQVAIDRIAFINRAATLNRKLATAGLSGDFGLGLGASMQAQVTKGWLSDDLLNRAMRLSAAASDARMGGANLAAMSNSGSGNQGIAATMPLVAFAEMTAVDEERYLRALVLSHLCAIYIKSKQDKLSALCAATTAAMGACAALTWLMGGDLAAIHRAINAMVGDIAGVFCDGAKAGCAMKVSSGASSAVKSAILAISGATVSAQQGIVFASADQSIAELGHLSKTAMQKTDQAIIATIEQKCQA